MMAVACAGVVLLICFPWHAVVIALFVLGWQSVHASRADQPATAALGWSLLAIYLLCLIAHALELVHAFEATPTLLPLSWRQLQVAVICASIATHCIGRTRLPRWTVSSQLVLAFSYAVIGAVVFVVLSLLLAAPQASLAMAVTLACLHIAVAWMPDVLSAAEIAGRNDAAGAHVSPRAGGDVLPALPL